VTHFRVILMDQRGTGRSSQININNLKKLKTPELQAAHLQHFRCPPAFHAPPCSQSVTHQAPAMDKAGQGIL
jgi:pimeloyl-ACP methyl ester carboxylesterase